MYGLLVAITVLLSITLVLLVIGIALYVRRITQVARGLEATLAELRREIVPLASDVRHVLSNTDGLISSARLAVDSVGRVACTIERFVEGKTLADAAGKVASASRSTLAVIFEGAKEAIKAFKAAKVEPHKSEDFGVRKEESH